MPSSTTVKRTWSSSNASTTSQVLARGDLVRVYRDSEGALHLSQVPAAQAARLGRALPPAWCYVAVPKRAISSTDIRARGDWPD